MLNRITCNRNILFYFSVFLMYLNIPCCLNNDCRSFSKSVYNDVIAMPLLPRIHPFKIKPKKCGFVNPLIIGGRNARSGEYPYMVAVGYKQGEILEWLCGASLITRKYVLTSAHCAKTKWGSPDVIHLGSLRLDVKLHENIAVEKAIVHPAYNPPQVYNDIALLKLATDVTFHRTIQPACLSLVKNMTLLETPVVTAAGWGHTTFGGLPSRTLRKVELKITGNEECQKHFPLEKHLPNGIDDTMFCAVGHNQIFHDTCQGDSGGPVQATLDETKCLQQVIGITSFGKYCGSGSPAIYIKVASYMPWIESVIVDNTN